MNLSKFKYLSLVPLFALTSCGYGLKEIYPGNVYDSTVFVENYYTIWDSRIDSNNPKNSLHGDEEIIVLPRNKYFTSWEDPLFKSLQPEYEKYLFSELNNLPSEYGDEFDYDAYGNKTGKVIYSQEVKLSSRDETFKYGVTSKLYDGQAFCNGSTTKARVQLSPMHSLVDSKLDGLYHIDNTYASGFGQVLEKEFAGCELSFPYIAFNFKNFVEMNDEMASYLTGKEGATTSNLNDHDDSYSDIDLYISLYFKDVKQFKKKTFVLRVEDVSTNGRLNKYSFVGFPLTDIDLTHLNGFSVEYKLIDIHDTYVPRENFINKMEELNLHYGLWLYEIFFPYTNWR